MSDEDLIEGARAGQPHAGPFLVSLYGPKVLGYCKSIASDLSDVDHEHIVANAIERAVRRIEKYDATKGSFEAWLRTFVLHSTQDWRRDNHRFATLAAPDDELDPWDNLPAPLTPQQLAADTSRHLRTMVEILSDSIPKLSELDQLIIHLRDTENRSVEEVATLLDIKQDACRQRHSRARARLKKLILADPRMGTDPTGATA